MKVLTTILFPTAYIRPLEKILAKKITELILLYKKTNKLVFVWPNMGQEKHHSVNKLNENIYN